MPRKFQNPANNHEETVGAGASVGAFFLGGLYLIYKGLWPHFFVWTIVIGLGAVVDPYTFILTVPLLSIFYCLAIQQILATRYLRRGWLEVGPTVSTDDELAKSTSTVLAGPDPMLPRASKGDTKLCPFCAEEVKVAAIRCKHCQADLPVAA